MAFSALLYEIYFFPEVQIIITIAKIVFNRIGSDGFIYLSCSRHVRAEGALSADRILDSEFVAE